MSPAVGQQLGPWRLAVGSEQVRRYGDLARDHNPVHFDDAAAQRLGLPGRIAHGMISGSGLAVLLGYELGAAWTGSARYRWRFVAPLPVGATVVLTASVVRDEPLLLDLLARDESGHAVITGTAEQLDPKSPASSH